ncbi:unnamed protein product [Schistosoma turkestanicum]|nr:unnamed protein product [Schistosoma turkestanicum]
MKDSSSQYLLNWCIEQTKVYPHIKITDFTTSWKDGLAFCALIHKHFPDLIDFPQLKSEDAVKNIELAFFVAETKLNIPVLISPKVIVFEDVDEKHIVDYVSRLYGALIRRSSDTYPDKNLSYLCERAEGLPLCDLCGETIFRFEQLTVSSRNYHRSCFRENQLTYLEERNATLRSSNASKDLPLSKFSDASSSSIKLTPGDESDTGSHEKRQPVHKPSRPPLPDILSNNASSRLNSVLKTQARKAASTEYCENNSDLVPENIVSYPAALNPFEDDYSSDSNPQHDCKHKPYNPFDEDLLIQDSEKDNDISVSDPSEKLDILNPPSPVQTPGDCTDRNMERSEHISSMKQLAPDEPLNFRTAHSSICDLSSLLAYGRMSKEKSSSPSSHSTSSSKPLNGSDTRITRSVITKGPAPPIPVLCRRDVRSDRRTDFISYSELHKRLYEINNELSGLELAARQIQTSIREMSEDDGSVKELLKQWLHTVQLKDNLFRKESELLQRLRCQELEDRHAELEYELRALIAKQGGNLCIGKVSCIACLIQSLLLLPHSGDSDRLTVFFIHSSPDFICIFYFF